MLGNTFEIDTSDTHTSWAELQGTRIIIHRTDRSPPGQDETLLNWDIDVLRNLLAWAGQEGSVTTSLTGPLAHQIREHSKELGMTPEMFVWHAVKIFIEVGTDS